MANDHHAPVDIDPKELERAQVMWANFAEASKWTIIAICVLLTVMAITLVKF